MVFIIPNIVSNKCSTNHLRYTQVWTAAACTQVFVFFCSQYNSCDLICVLKATVNFPVHFSHSLTLAVSHFLVHVATGNTNLFSNKPLSIYLGWWGAGNHMHMRKVLWAVTHEQDIAANKIKAFMFTRASCHVSRHKSLMLPGEHVSTLGNILREILKVRWTFKTEAVLTGFVKCSSGRVPKRDKIRKLANEKQSCCWTCLLVLPCCRYRSGRA